MCLSLMERYLLEQYFIRKQKGSLCGVGSCLKAILVSDDKYSMNSMRQILKSKCKLRYLNLEEQISLLNTQHCIARSERKKPLFHERFLLLNRAT